MTTADGVGGITTIDDGPSYHQHEHRRTDLGKARCVAIDPTQPRRQPTDGAPVASVNRVRRASARRHGPGVACMSEPNSAIRTVST
jgi:hypothetical protein